MSVSKLVAMNEQSPPIFFGQRGAVLLGVLLLAGIALMSVVGAFDRSHLKSLETFDHSTAIGDNRFFQPPTDSRAFTSPVVTLAGTPLFLSKTRSREIDDFRMIRLGVDPSSNVSIYQSKDSLEAKEAPGKKGPPIYFLKIGPGEYIKATSASPKNAEARN